MANTRKRMYPDSDFSANSLRSAIAATGVETAYRDINGQLLSIVQLTYSQSNQAQSGPLQKSRQGLSQPSKRYALISHDEGDSGVDAFFALLSDSLPFEASESFDETRKHLQATVSERHSLINIHQEMFFYCQRVLNSSLKKDVDITERQRMFNEIYDNVYRAINNDIACWLNSGSFLLANFVPDDRKRLEQLLRLDEKKGESQQGLSLGLREKLLKKLESQSSWKTWFKKAFGAQEKELFLSAEEALELEQFLGEDSLRDKLKKHLSTDEINQYVDQCRGSYSLLARTRVVSQLVVDNIELNLPENTAILTNEKSALKKAIKRDLGMHVAVDDLDQVESNQVLGLVTHTEGVNTTAHSKGKAKPAVAQIDQYAYDADGNGEYEHIQTQFRCPSLQALRGWIDWFRGKNSPSEKVRGYIDGFVNDRGLKLEDGPITYNLLTSINFSAVDAFDNHQTETARDIFLATHLYNKGTNDNSKPLCLVMNLPINQHTLNLGYDSWTDVGREAMLFSEWAIMAQVASGWLKDDCKVTGRNDIAEGTSVNSWLKDQLTEVKDQYNTFLRNGAEGMFVDSKEGKRAQQHLVNIRSQVTFVINAELTDPTLDSSKTALKLKAAATLDSSKKTRLKTALMKLYLRQFDGKTSQAQEVYSGVIQAMHIALTKNGLEGCKSANERYGLFIKSLANLFLAYAQGSLSEEANNAVDMAIEGLLNGEKMRAQLDNCGQWHEKRYSRRHIFREDDNEERCLAFVEFSDSEVSTLVDCDLAFTDEQKNILSKIRSRKDGIMARSFQVRGILELKKVLQNTQGHEVLKRLGEKLSVEPVVTAVNLSADHLFTHRMLKANNQFNAYSSSTHAAQNDTGTPKAGVEPNPTSPYDIAVHHWNTTTFLPGQNDRVKQSCAKEVQAHKGLPKDMVKMYGLAEKLKSKFKEENTLTQDEVYIEVCKQTLKEYLKIDKYKISRFLTRNHREVIKKQVNELGSLAEDSKDIKSVLGMLEKLLNEMKKQESYNKDGLATKKIQQLQTLGQGFFDDRVGSIFSGGIDLVPGDSLAKYSGD
jgi:hypothetical protein